MQTFATQTHRRPFLLQVQFDAHQLDSAMENKAYINNFINLGIIECNFSNLVRCDGLVNAIADYISNCNSIARIYQSLWDERS